MLDLTSEAMMGHLGNHVHVHQKQYPHKIVLCKDMEGQSNLINWV